jgi:hypothetical protein
VIIHQGPRARPPKDVGAKTPLRSRTHVGDTMAIAYRAVGKPVHQRTETERRALAELWRRMAEVAR